MVGFGGFFVCWFFVFEAAGRDAPGPLQAGGRQGREHRAFLDRREGVTNGSAPKNASQPACLRGSSCSSVGNEDNQPVLFSTTPGRMPAIHSSVTVVQKLIYWGRQSQP